VRRKAIECLGLEPSQIVTILNGIDLSPFRHPSEERAAIRAQLGLAPEDIVIGSVGRLHRQKNFSFLIRLAHNLGARFDKARFVIIGDGEEQRMLEALIVEYGLVGKVLLPGFRLDIPRILPAFDIFVLPSLYEGLPRSVMEAMAAGLPCVASDVGGNAEAVQHGETGFVCRAGDAESFASSIEQLLHDAELRSKMGQAGRTRAFRLFGADRVAQQYADLYTTLLRQAGQAGGN